MTVDTSDWPNNGVVIEDPTAEPSITDLQMTGSLEVNGTLAASYKFVGGKGEQTDKSLYSWGTKGQTIAAVSTSKDVVVTSGTVPGYKILGTDVGKVMELSVLAKNGLGVVAKKIVTVDTSDWPNNGVVIDPVVVPYIKDLSIALKAGESFVVGSTLEATYKFDPLTGERTNKSNYLWGTQNTAIEIKTKGKPVDANGNVQSYKILLDDVGKAIELSVQAKNTLVSNNVPVTVDTSAWDNGGVVTIADADITSSLNVGNGAIANDISTNTIQAKVFHTSSGGALKNIPVTFTVVGEATFVGGGKTLYTTTDTSGTAKADLVSTKYGDNQVTAMVNKKIELKGLSSFIKELKIVASSIKESLKYTVGQAKRVDTLFDVEAGSEGVIYSVDQLPEGFSFDSEKNALTFESSSFAFAQDLTVNATDNGGQFVSAKINIQVLNAPITIASVIPQQLQINVQPAVYKPLTLVQGTGLPPYTYESDFDFKNYGLTFSTENGQVSGMPTAGLFEKKVLFKVKDANGVYSAPVAVIYSIFDAVVSSEPQSLTTLTPAPLFTPIKSNGGVLSYQRYSYIGQLPSGLIYKDGNVTGTPDVTNAADSTVQKVTFSLTQNGIVKSTTVNYSVSKFITGILTTGDYGDAKNYCQGMGARLPTKVELKQIYNKNKTSTDGFMCSVYGWPLKNQCGGTEDWYWTSDLEANSGYPYLINMRTEAEATHSIPRDTHNARCIK